MMQIIGVDLSAKPGNTSLCRIEWIDRPVVTKLITPADNKKIIETVREAGTLGRDCALGLDCPLGWPDLFVATVAKHRNRQPTGAKYSNGPQKLRLRRTDEHVKEKTGHSPLSVSTDKLGSTALRGIEIMERLVNSVADRCGASGIYEVYPAASLAKWGLPSQKYKDKDNNKEEARKNRCRIIEVIAKHVELGTEKENLLENDDNLDALICALTAGLAVAGRTIPPPAGNDIIASEGWIHVPKGGLPDLGCPLPDDHRQAHADA